MLSIYLFQRPKEILFGQNGELDMVHALATEVGSVFVWKEQIESILEARVAYSISHVSGQGGALDSTGLPSQPLTPFEASNSSYGPILLCCKRTR